MKRIGMGLVGPGFVGLHHVDAVRRLGFVDVVAVAASSEEAARKKADALGVPKAYGSYEALAADPDVHVVHNATPNHLHPTVIRAALAHRKHVVSDKPLANSAADSYALWQEAIAAGVTHAVTFNYRGNPLVQEAREQLASGQHGAVHHLQGGYLGDWLLEATDFNWRLEADKGGPSIALADIGSHFFDLAEHVLGARITHVLADLTTVIPERRRPSGEPFISTSSELATVLLRFDDGAKGCATFGQVFAGHKNGLWFEISAREASLRWEQESQNALWIGRRNGASSVLPKDPSLLSPSARAYARLPGGHQEGWADAFFNVLNDVYTAIAEGYVSGPRPPAFATFEDGYRAACVQEAALESHRRGGVWTEVTRRGESNG